MTADPIEAKVGDMMLAAGIETATDFDMKVLYSFIHCVTFFSHALTQFASQPARRCNTKFAGIGAGARSDVNDRSCTRQPEANCFQCSINFRQVSLTDPA